MIVSLPEQLKLHRWGITPSAVKSSVPVMCCHPAEENGGVTTRLVRGVAPSTPFGKQSRSVKKFFRVTPEENAVILTHAANAGLLPSSYMRLQMLGKPKLRNFRRVRADWDELRRCLGAINKAGNVVNQFVVVLRRRHVQSDLADTALSELREAARQVTAALKGL